MAKKEKEIFDFGEDEEIEEVEPEIISTFRANVLTKNINLIPMCDLGGLKIIRFKVEADTDYIAGSVFTLCKLPPSEIRVLFKLSDINFMGVSDGKFGHSKYRTRKRENIPRSEDGLNDAIQDGKDIKLDSLEGIFVTFTTAHAGEKGDYLEGYIVYSKL